VSPLFFFQKIMQKTNNHLKQGIGYGLVQVLGVVVGAVSTVFLYGHVLEAYGAVQFFLSTAALLFPIASLGVYALNYHFFPIFENKDNEHHGFLALLLIWGVSGTALCVLSGWLIWPFFQTYVASSQPSVLFEHIGLLGPILMFTVLNFTLAHYAVNLGRMTVPALLNDLFLKLAVPILLLLYLGKWLDVAGVLYALTAYLGLTTLALLYYVRPFGRWRWLPDRRVIKLPEMARYAGYNTLTGLGVSVLARLDLVMLGLLLSPEFVGGYAVAVTIAGVLEIPFKTASTMSAPIISRHLHKYEYKKLEAYLKNSAGYLFFVALAIAGGVLLCSADLFALMPQTQLLGEARTVLWLLVLVKLVDAAMGLNGYVLMLSSFYRYHFGTVAVVLCVHATLLFHWIPQHGMVGAAMSTLAAVFLFNVLSALIVYFKIGIQSFSGKMLTSIIVMSVSAAATHLTTYVFQPTFFILLLKGVIYLAIFFGLTFALRLMPEEEPWGKLKNKPSFKSNG